ncbi:uncharacterized protein PFL1_05960 [Pseudozyma flocculosa PF-1]|uniref:Uncharacterized protein n=2 Tax=Pseudozyma flocculosa TaxID=84751 RepID=A0A5C3F1H2_9BASI|nr:uncharacterized protein PFL1_05960 [Pseudozyma flocculosa PF-1]EPQ26639.1 hypothetical protein PFL1_05960 [Pseudozyma flocculosa PF-1]SPO38364.1 uncharacterized protein PSFLO_03841 [Pseudozyma flocculosa]
MVSFKNLVTVGLVVLGALVSPGVSAAGLGPFQGTVEGTIRNIGEMYRGYADLTGDSDNIARLVMNDVETLPRKARSSFQKFYQSHPELSTVDAFQEWVNADKQRKFDSQFAAIVAARKEVYDAWRRSNGRK